MPDVRHAVAGDAPAIQALYRQLVDNSAVSVLPERIAAIANDPNTALLVCERKDALVGTVLVSLCADVMFQWQPFAVIENIVVDSACRGLGVGTALMQEVEAFCLRADCSKIMLLSSIGRTDAHQFFGRMGFAGSTKRGFVKYRRQFKAIHGNHVDVP